MESSSPPESVPPPSSNRTKAEELLARRLRWITALRLVLLTALLVTIALFYLGGTVDRFPTTQSIVLGAVGAGFVLSVGYALQLRRRKALVRLAETQLVLDQLTWTVIVYVTGGATSGATSFYGLTCLVGAILIGFRGSAIAAISGLGAFSSLCVGFSVGAVSPPHDQLGGSYLVSWITIIYPLGVNVLGIAIVALLAGYLAERLRRTGGELQEAMARAAAAEQLATLGRVAAGLAHEIRNPLGSIRGSVELLREAPGLSDEDRRLCEIIERETVRLNQLVSDMMDVSRPRRPEPSHVDVASLARDVVELASRSERSGAGDVHVAYAGPERPSFAVCDGAQMRQVLWNLVRNAVQASGAGSTVRVTVTEEGSPTQGRVVMAVSDQGPGIPDGDRAKIFDAFFTTRSKGAGMGLAVVRRIIDDHAPYGATLDVETSRTAGGKAPKRGATFKVGLARAPAPGRSTA